MPPKIIYATDPVHETAQKPPPVEKELNEQENPFYGLPIPYTREGTSNAAHIFEMENRMKVAKRIMSSLLEAPTDASQSVSIDLGESLPVFTKAYLMDESDRTKLAELANDPTAASKLTNRQLWNSIQQLLTVII